MLLAKRFQRNDAVGNDRLVADIPGGGGYPGQGHTPSRYAACPPAIIDAAVPRSGAEGRPPFLSLCPFVQVDIP